MNCLSVKARFSLINYAINSIKAGARLVGALLCLLGLSACNTAPQKESVVVVPSPSVPKQSLVAPTSPIVVSMLERADTLYAQGRFLSPEEDNAYIRYRAVQMMEPENSQARSGLSAILVNYVQVLRDDLERGRVSQAQRQLDQLKPLFSGERILLELEEEIRETRKALNVAAIEKKQKETPLDDGRVYLDVRELAARTPVIQAQLAEMANALVESDESIMIYARNDAEGRWIYGQMRQAVTNYRIRGDIRIGKPAIRFLPPLD